MADHTDDEVRVRRATPTDRDAVIDINDDVYDGNDYLPTIYEQLVDNEAPYAAYVAELDGKLVAFASFGMIYPEPVSSILALRVRAGYEGRGLTRLLRRQFLADFPTITHFLYDGFLTTEASDKLKKCRRLMRANLCVYEVDGTQLRSWCGATVAQSSSTSVDRELSSDECRQLVSSGRCRSVLSCYVTDYVPLGSSVWEPVAIVDEERMITRLLELRTKITDKDGAQRSNTFCKFLDERVPLAGSPDVPYSSLHRVTARRPFIYLDEAGSRFTDPEGDLRAVSFSGGFLLKTRSKHGQVLVNIYFHGDDIEDLRDHVVDHVRHLASHVIRGRDTTMYLHFPYELNVDDVDSVVRGAVPDQQQSTGTHLDFMVLKRTSELYMALEEAR